MFLLHLRGLGIISLILGGLGGVLAHTGGDYREKRMERQVRSRIKRKTRREPP
jgi:hypothetical protein